MQVLAAKSNAEYELWRIKILSRWYRMRKAKLDVPPLKEGPCGKLSYLLPDAEPLDHDSWEPITYEALVKVLDLAERKMPTREERSSDGSGRIGTSERVG